MIQLQVDNDVNDATNGVITTPASNARMIVVGNTLMCFVPRDEFLSDNIGYRMTALDILVIGVRTEK